MHSHLAIVTGVSNPIGNAFADAFIALPQTNVVGLSRSPVERENVRYRALPNIDLLEATRVQDVVRKLQVHAVDDVTLVHAVGKFKFEDPPPPRYNLDADIIASNLHTFENIVSALLTELDLARNTRTRLSICMLGSVSDVYRVPFWQSYTKAKNLMRAFLSHVITAHSRRVIKGLSLDMSSVDTNCRNPSHAPLGSLPLSEFIEQAMPEIKALIASKRSEYRRINIFRDAPEGFDWQKYYADHEAIRARWRSRKALYSENT